MSAANTPPRLTLAMDLDRVEALSADLERIAEARDAAAPLMRELVAHFKARVPHYHWVGFYLRAGDELGLALYAGAPPLHPRLPIGAGMCAAAVASGQAVIVSEVQAEARALACSPQARSEIAVPISDGRRVLGVIAIDSDQPNAFNEHDQALLERAASFIAGALQRAAQPPRWSEPEAVSA